MDQRRHPRFKTTFDALCSSGREEGFSIEYEIESPEVRGLVDDVAALVSAW